LGGDGPGTPSATSLTQDDRSALGSCSESAPGRSDLIGTTSLITSPPFGRPARLGFGAGDLPGAGTFSCLDCGSQLAIEEAESLPECPTCGGAEFRRDSIFASMQEHGSQTVEFAAALHRQPPGWLEEARRSLPAIGRFLAFSDDDEVQVFELEPGWTRIGRSHAADLCLDDPSVSRRHALIVSEPPKPLRILDDRSLNGLFLNGERVEWARLGDGDELAIGRYRLFALEA
jgi:FHA domain/Zinc-ribbon containing domain